MQGSVEVMLSYDYCHFEITLGNDKEMTLKEVNEMRKSAQRLADEAVRQYKVAKDFENKRAMIARERARLEREVAAVKNIPKREWTAEQRAKVKSLEDRQYWEQYAYDYEDELPY